MSDEQKCPECGGEVTGKGVLTRYACENRKRDTPPALREAELERQLAQAREENARLGKWVADLQSGMYVNCVYCGHRYGPGSTTPVSMADALKTHIENCPKHPMSALKSDNQRLQAIVDRLPKTADGVPVVQGDTLFGVSEIDGRIVRLTADEPTLWTAIEDLPDEGVSDERVWDFCVNAYSTREAAARAAEARVLQGGGEGEGMSTGDFLMPFGTHKDEPLSEIPTEYLDYVLGFDNLWPSTRDAIVTHLRTRADWQNMDREDD